MKQAVFYYIGVQTANFRDRKVMFDTVWRCKVAYLGCISRLCTRQYAYYPLSGICTHCRHTDMFKWRWRREICYCQAPRAWRNWNTELGKDKIADQWRVGSFELSWYWSHPQFLQKRTSAPRNSNNNWTSVFNIFDLFCVPAIIVGKWCHLLLILHDKKT